jgi:hypothetical protein
MKVFLLCSTQWASNYVTSPNTSTCTSPTPGKEIRHVTYNGSNFNNNVTASFQQQHRSSYSTSSEFLSESSPDDSLGDFEGTKFLTYVTGYFVSPQCRVGLKCTPSGQPRRFPLDKSKRGLKLNTRLQSLIRIQRAVIPLLLLHLSVVLNPLKTKRKLFYLNTQFVPRSKHFLSRL